MSKTKRMSQEAITVIIFLIVIAIIASIAVPIILSFMGKDDTTPHTPPVMNVEPTEVYAKDYGTTSMVGYSAKIVGYTTRNVPEVMHDEGFKEEYGKDYPSYGKGPGYTEEERKVIINENISLCGVATTNTGGSYDKIDKDGVLWRNGEVLTYEDGSPRKLYKHSASVGLYGGNVSANERGVIKQITLRNRGYDSYSVTGLYAPAGEVIKVEIDGDDFDRIVASDIAANQKGRTIGLVFHIGQALYNGQANNIWSAKELNRMPILLNTLEVTKELAEYDEERNVYTAYIGSFLGGPIYIRNEDVTFTVTISGAVNYSHFILGYTTKEEFENNRKSTAPYFDLEVWDHGVLHSGPKSYSTAYSYEQLYDAAIYWDKVSNVSNAIRAGSSKQGIVFLYDPFVAAGAAVAFPGRRSVNCPASWMSSSLNYKALSTSGAWGNMHEYNHNFQGWGRGEGGEVTNNALNLVEYALFTRISSERQMENYGANGLSDWNRYTSATWAINQAIRGNGVNRENDLSNYAAILHSFGPDMFIKAINSQTGGQGETNWARAVTLATHQNVKYFYQKLVGYSVSDTYADGIEGFENYPTFIPVASVYQTGRSFVYDGEKKYIKTQQPYRIDENEDFVVDLRRYTVNSAGQYLHEGSIVLPNGFEYTIKEITSPTNGTLSQYQTTNEAGETVDVKNCYLYHPDHKGTSGEIIVTLEITAPEGSGIETQEVDLVLEFETSNAFNKLMLERTHYVFDKNVKEYQDFFTSAKEAYEYIQENPIYKSKYTEDNTNPTQNSNTDIWYSFENPAPNNELIEINGKIYVDETADYRLQLRGRWSVALYYSLDGGKTYKFGVEMNRQPSDSGAGFQTVKDENGRDVAKPGTYIDFIDKLKVGQWVYFKELMFTDARNISSFVGLGWGKFTPAVPELSAAGLPTGKEAQPASVSIKYASAYRNSFEFDGKEFETDYFYANNYSYDYVEEDKYQKEITFCAEQSNFEPWSADYGIENLFDGNSATAANTKQYTKLESFDGNKSDVKATVDAYRLVFDMQKEIKANQLVLYLRKLASGNQGRPIDLNLYYSNDGEEFTLLKPYVNLIPNGLVQTLDFNSTNFRYLKLEVTKTDNGYFSLTDIEVKYSFRITGGKHLSPDENAFVFKGEWDRKAGQSSFGHTYVGKKNTIMEFTFTGERFGILSSREFGGEFEVYIDGEKMSSIELKESTGDIYMSYISQLQANRIHTVKIKCTGSASIDSIVVW